MAPHWNRASGAAATNGDSGATALDIWQPGRLLDETPALDRSWAPLGGRALRFDYNITALSGTTPGIQFIVETHHGDGNWVAVWTSAVITATGTGFKLMGPGYDSTWPGPAARVRYLISGTGGPSVTFSATLKPAKVGA